MKEHDSSEFLKYNVSNKSILLSNLTVKGFTFINRYACAPFGIATATEDGSGYGRKR